MASGMTAVRIRLKTRTECIFSHDKTWSKTILHPIPGSAIHKSSGIFWVQNADKTGTFSLGYFCY
jgi:hypothetical protein